MKSKPTIASLDRDRIKSLVASGRINEIQQAMDNGHFKRKQRKVAEVDTDTHRLHIVATTDTVDRDSERVLPSSLEKDFGYYQENPVVLFGHDHHIPAVGMMTDYSFSDEQMKMEIEFAVDENPFARMLWGLYSKGYMRMSSIGFIPLEATDDAEMKLEGQQGLTYLRNEIIELSLVNVGSNRYALSDLSTVVKGDPVMRDLYAALVEEPTALAVEKPSEKSAAIQIPAENANLPIHIHLNVGGESEEGDIETTKAVSASVESVSDTEKETSEAMQQRKQQTCPTRKRKASAAAHGKLPRLVRLLNKHVDAEADRSTSINEIAEEALITTEQVDQALKGEYALDDFEIEAFAKALSVDADLLLKAADSQEASEPEASEEDTETSEELEEEFEDETKTFSESYNSKFYGMVGASFEGSFEERQAAIYPSLREYLEFEFDLGEHAYLDISVLATYDDHVIVKDWDDDSVYKASYSVDADGDVDFTDLVEVRIRTTYEEIEDENGKMVRVESAFAEAAD